MVYYGLYKVLDVVFQGLYLAIIVRVIVSWIPHNPYHPIMHFIYRVTDPILRPFQQMFPSMGIDFSPLLALIAIGMVKKLLFSLLF